jgi:hypothetical protein
MKSVFHKSMPPIQVPIFCPACGNMGRVPVTILGKNITCLKCYFQSPAKKPTRCIECGNELAFFFPCDECRKVFCSERCARSHIKEAHLAKTNEFLAKLGFWLDLCKTISGQ